MSGSHAVRRVAAFTLVELLVVIGIIAVLISILLPALQKARQSAVTVQCASNMRTLGQGMLTFANDFGGRMPAGGQYASPSWSSCSWDEVLNLHYFKLGSVNRFNGRTGLMRWVNGVVTDRALGCPALVVGDLGTGGRAFGMNVFLAGSTDNSGSFVNGILHPDPTYFHNDFANPGASDPTRRLGFVRLGARITKFNNTSDKIMVIEKERANAWANSTGTNPVSMGNDPTYNSYAANGGQFTFRHNRRTRMNTLFLDGHVGSFHFTDRDFNVRSRYDYN